MRVDQSDAGAESARGRSRVGSVAGSRPGGYAGGGGDVARDADSGVYDMGTARVKAACFSLTSTSNHSAAYAHAPSLRGAYAERGPRRTAINRQSSTRRPLRSSMRWPGVQLEPESSAGRDATRQWFGTDSPTGGG